MYKEDKLPVFILADRDTGETFINSTKTADESTIRLLLGKRQLESLTVYTDGFRAYEPLNSDSTFDRRYVVHGGSEHADDGIHVDTCEKPHRSLSKDKLTPYLRGLQLRQRTRRNPGDKALKIILETAPWHH